MYQIPPHPVEVIRDTADGGTSVEQMTRAAVEAAHPRETVIDPTNVDPRRVEFGRAVVDSAAPVDRTLSPEVLHPDTLLEIGRRVTAWRSAEQDIPRAA